MQLSLLLLFSSIDTMNSILLNLMSIELTLFSQFPLL